MAMEEKLWVIGISATWEWASGDRSGQEGLVWARQLSHSSCVKSFVEVPKIFCYPPDLIRLGEVIVDWTLA